MLMRGTNRERKLLHEHEAFLFIFLAVFLLGGFALWGADVHAVEYYLEGAELSTEGLNLVEVLLEEGKIVDISVKNSEKEELVDSAIVIYEVDLQCNSLDSESLDSESGCEYLSLNLPSVLTVYPEEIVNIGLEFFPEERVELSAVVNIITNKGVNSFSFEFKVVDELEVVEVEKIIDVEVEENPILDLIERIVAMGKELTSIEDVPAEIYTGEKIVFVDDETSLGFTDSMLNFGPLDIEEGEQKTKKLGIENLGLEDLIIEGIRKDESLIVDPSKKMALIGGERKYVEITCAPIEERVVENIIVLETSRGEVEIKLFCEGVLASEKIVDETAPIINILKPLEGKVGDSVEVSVEAFDEGTILEVAVLKVYFNSVVMKRFVEPTELNSNKYDFELDISRFSGIGELRVEAVDHAGNVGVSEIIALWIEENELELDEEFELLDPEILITYPDGGVIGSPDLMNVQGIVGEVDVEVKFETLEGDFNFKFRGGKADRVNELEITSGDINFRDISGTLRVIDLPDELLKNTLITLESKTVILPMFKPKNYVSGERIGVAYFREDGSQFAINPEDVLNFYEEGELLYVEFVGDALVSNL